MAERRLARPPARAGGQRPLLDRLRQRRLVDLLRARPRRVVRARPHAGRLHHHRLHLLPDGRHLRRGDGDVPGGRRLVVASPAAPSTSSASFFAAWAQMLNYTITIAISAFFVPHYLGGVSASTRCATARPTSSSASASSSSSAWSTSSGVKESAGRQHPAGRRRLPHPAAARARRRRASSSRPSTLIDNVHLGVAPTWKDFFLAIPVGMIAYTGIETISNMAEEAKDETKTIPAAINRVVIAVFAIYALLPAVALSRAAGRPSSADGDYSTLLGLPEDQGGFAGDPVLGVVKHIDLGLPAGARPRSTSACSRRRSSSSPPTRGSSASRGWSTRWACTARCPTACASCTRSYGTPWIGILLFGGDRLPGDDPRPGRVPGQHVRVRGDAVVHDRAHLGHPPAQALPGRQAPVPGPGQHRARAAASLPLFAVFGGIGTGLAFVVVTVAAPRRRARRASAGWRSAASSTRSTAAARAST